jgi:uncharacterized membrane protein
MTAGIFTAMTTANENHDVVLFSARLTPHRSLSRGGFFALMGFFGAVSFATGMAFLMMGAWPVFGFFGLDVLIIWLAFRINFKRGNAHEDILITPSEVSLRRVTHRGHVVQYAFNPLWVQLDQKIDPEYGVERLTLVSRGRRVSVASFLGAEEKESFAKALLAALQAARRGVTYNPL